MGGALGSGLGTTLAATGEVGLAAGAFTIFGRGWTMVRRIAWVILGT